MRKHFIIVIISILSIVSLYTISVAETNDLSSMDFESLMELKLAVDAEVHSRPESSPLKLVPGCYIVGQDIKAGHYYAAAIDTSGSFLNRAAVFVYAVNGECIFKEYYTLGEQPNRLPLEDGNEVYIEDATIVLKTTEFTDEEICVYTPPEGVYVPAGIYIVGKDIPADRYTIYSTDIEGDRVYIWYNESNYETSLSSCDDRFLVNHKYQGRVMLNEGFVIQFLRDVIMIKQAAIQFD